MNNIVCGSLILLSLVSACPVTAELKDPYTRDDDLSYSIVNVDTQVRSDGQYLYSYEVHSPEINTGYILSFAIDLSCDAPLLHPGLIPSRRNSIRQKASLTPIRPTAIMSLCWSRLTGDKPQEKTFGQIIMSTGL